MVPPLEDQCRADTFDTLFHTVMLKNANAVVVVVVVLSLVVAVVALASLTTCTNGVTCPARW